MPQFKYPRYSRGPDNLHSSHTVMTKISAAKRNLPFGKPIIEEEERAAVMDVLAGPILVHGPRATAFENEFAAFTGAPQAVRFRRAQPECIHLVWFTLGLGPGDEVIVPAQTTRRERARGRIDRREGGLRRMPSRIPAISTLRRLQAPSRQRPGPSWSSIIFGMPVDMTPVVALARKHKLLSWKIARSRSGRASMVSTQVCMATPAYSPFTRSSI